MSYIGICMFKCYVVIMIFVCIFECVIVMFIDLDVIRNYLFIYYLDLVSEWFFVDKVFEMIM